MQSGIIEEILAVEDEAEQIVKDAQAEARRIISEAHGKADKIISDAVDAARLEGQRQLDAAEARMNAGIAEYGKDRLSDEKAESGVSREIVERATGRIVSLILSTGA